MTVFNGSCMCAAVTFTFTADAPVAYQCHCSLCRKVTGSAFTTTIMAPEAGFAWTEGKEHIIHYARESGYKVNFCRHCGSPLPNNFRGYPYYCVPVGSLDDAPDIAVAVQLFMAGRPSWDADPPAGDRYDNMPALDEILALLHISLAP